MRGPGAVDDDRTGPPLPEVKAAGSEGSQESFAVGAFPPGCQGGRTQVIEADPGPLLDQAFLGAQAGHRPGGRRRPRGLHPVRHVVPALLAKGLHDASGMLRRRRARHAVLELHDPGAPLAPGEVEPDVDDVPRRLHEAVHAVLMPAAVLDVNGPAHGLRGEPELLLEQCPEAPARAVVVRDLQVGVTVHVVAGAVRPAAERQGDELANLTDQVGGAEAPGREDDDLLVLVFQEMAGESVAAHAPHGAADHCSAAG